jgi:hypothetical protein
MEVDSGRRCCNIVGWKMPKEGEMGMVATDCSRAAVPGGNGLCMECAEELKNKVYMEPAREPAPREPIMTEEGFDDEFYECLRNAIQKAFSLSNDIMIGGKVISLYGIEKPMAACIAGRELNLPPKQTAALFTMGQKIIFDNESGGFFKSLLSGSGGKKTDLDKVATIILNESPAITAQTATNFMNRYLRALASIGDD